MTVTVGTPITIAGRPMRVERLLGAGGEGEVFEVVGSDASDRFALKWYYESTTTAERRAAITDLVNRGAPSHKFLWPHGIIEDPATDRFGYLMDVRPTGYIGIASLLRGEVARDEVAVVRFAFELAMAFRELHLRGLCYRDINFGNAFMELDTGAALVCDNDNVAVEGVGRARVLGARKFMAPEIVRGEAMPSKFTDRYSLAVMLFYLLVVHHPLEGARTEVGLADATADLRHYGYEPLFCFDPEDDTNRPLPDLHHHVQRMWRALPTRMRELFTRSFTDGLDHPTRRVVDTEWCEALAEMRSHQFVCVACGRACYLEITAIDRSCPHCGTDPGAPMVLSIANALIALRPRAVVAQHHLRGDLDFGAVHATVEAHPTEPGRLGLRNDTSKPLPYVTASDRELNVPPGRRALVEVGARVVVDDLIGRVHSVDDLWPGRTPAGTHPSSPGAPSSPDATPTDARPRQHRPKYSV